MKQQKKSTPGTKKLTTKEREAKLREEQQQRMLQARLEKERKMQEQNEEIENLNKNLLKKLYRDLFMQNTDYYLEKNLTFENFLFHFYKDIIGMIDYYNPNYKQLLQKVDLKIKTKFEVENQVTPDLNPNELRKKINSLSEEDEWALIHRYKEAKYLEQKKKEEEQEKIKKENYFRELDQQIEDKKNRVDPHEQELDKIYDHDEIVAKELLQKLKVQNQISIDTLRKNNENNEVIKPYILDDIENSNLELNEENKDLITYKVNFLKKLEDDEDNEMSQYVDQIMNEKKLEKIENIIKTAEYKKDLRRQMNEKYKNYERPDKMSIEEIKLNKKLLEESREYFGLKNKI